MSEQRKLTYAEMGREMLAGPAPDLLQTLLEDISTVEYLRAAAGVEPEEWVRQVERGTL